MARTLSLAAAVALTLLALIFASRGVSLEGSTLERLALGAERVASRVPLESRAEDLAWPVARSPASPSAASPQNGSIIVWSARGSIYRVGISVEEEPRGP